MLTWAAMGGGEQWLGLGHTGFRGVFLFFFFLLKSWMHSVISGGQLTVMPGFLSCTRVLPFSELWTCVGCRRGCRRGTGLCGFSLG